MEREEFGLILVFVLLVALFLAWLNFDLSLFDLVTAWLVQAVERCVLDVEISRGNLKWLQQKKKQYVHSGIPGMFIFSALAQCQLSLTHFLSLTHCFPEAVDVHGIC